VLLLLLLLLALLSDLIPILGLVVAVLSILTFPSLSTNAFLFNNCVNGLPVSLDALTSPFFSFYSICNKLKKLGHKGVESNP
jgi:hypothetical protein